MRTVGCDARPSCANVLKEKRLKTVVTYGTYDIFHAGHLNLLLRARALGDKLYVGISSDEFNAVKGKRSFFSFDERAKIVEALKCVDGVFREDDWGQKRSDILKYHADIFVMGDDWAGKFDELKDLCEVVYLPRTRGVSTTEIKQALSRIDPAALEQLRSAISAAAEIVRAIQ